MSSLSSTVSSVSSDQTTAMGYVHGSMRWCNHLYEEKCPYKAGGECAFLHMDAVVERELYQTEAFRADAPNLIEKTMKALAKEMHQQLRAEVEKAGGHTGVVGALRELGWVLPDAGEEAHAQAVSGIIMVAVRTLHFTCLSSGAIMFRTVRYFLALGRGASSVPATAEASVVVGAVPALTVDVRSFSLMPSTRRGRGRVLGEDDDTSAVELTDVDSSQPTPVGYVRGWLCSTAGSSCGGLTPVEANGRRRESWMSFDESGSTFRYNPYH